jgi:hypothetical protein
LASLIIDMAPAPCHSCYSLLPSKSRGRCLLGLASILFGKAEGDSAARFLALRTACGISDDSVPVTTLFCGGTSHCQDAIVDLAEKLDDYGLPRNEVFSAFSSGCPLPTYEPTTQSPGSQANQLPANTELPTAGALVSETSGGRPPTAVNDGGTSGGWADDGRSIVEMVRRLQASLTEVCD